MFTEPEFQGNLTLIGEIEDGYCLGDLGQGYQSYRNNTNFEGYLYAEPDCKGQARPVTHGSFSPDIGFSAHSWKQACVSCRGPLGNALNSARRLPADLLQR